MIFCYFVLTKIILARYLLHIFSEVISRVGSLGYQTREMGYTSSNTIHGDDTLDGESAITVADFTYYPANTVLMYS